ncbi:MAG: MFS transporter [Phycisphaerae bacterium]|nr:MFS transporter [Phycisphaerae bacterium]
MRPIRLQLGNSFAWFNATQFFGALNDNVFKLLSIFFLIGLFGEKSATFSTTVAAAIFVVPFLLFTPYAGTLADRFSKRDIIVITKVAEVGVMLLGCLAFALESPFGVCAVLFLMCTQSAFFGPSKYGIVPELVHDEQLSRANSFLQALTYMAIVIGTAGAPALTLLTREHYTLAGLGCVVVAIVGLLCGVRIERTAPAGVGRRASWLFVKDVYKPLRETWGDHYLMLAVFASAYFLFVGAFLQMNLIPYGIQALGWDQIRSGYLFVPAAVGIGFGSWLAGRVSGRSIEFGIVPLGAIGLAVCCMAAAFVGDPQFKFVMLGLMFLTGISAGLFIVPLNAFIQLRSPAHMRGEVIAASGFLSWVGVLAAAALLFGLKLLGSSAAQSFFVIGLLTLVLAAVAMWILPDFLVRFVIVVLTRFVYRLRAVGAEHVPTQGGVLLVSNHVTWVDAALLGAAQERRIRFLIDRAIYNRWWVKPFCRLMRAIPISATDPPKQIMASLRAAREAMEEGFMVCIFAEGGVTRTGMLGQFRSGFEKIMKHTDYAVIPAHIGGAWGSMFSYYHGRLLAMLPRHFPHPVTVHFGAPMPGNSTAVEIRQAVMELSCDYFNSLKPTRRSLGEDFVRSARKHWAKTCISDATGKTLTFGRTLTAAVALADALKPVVGGQKHVGLLLPPSCGAALGNLAIALLGKVSVNLSYAATAEARAYAVEKCGLATVISSREFLEKAHIDDDMPGLIFIEDLVQGISPAQKRRSFLKARFVPRRRLANARGFCGDDVATIIFSSGSTGLPKGVVLSHHNISSNIAAALMVFKVYSSDMICSGLPFFHSFGLTFALWLPVLAGVATAYVPNPLDGKLLAQQVREKKATLLFATPTFLMTYIRRAEPEDFASLRLVLVGAEKLRTRLADSFEQKFGVRPMEGYGVTELSPLIALNVSDVEAGGLLQVGHKPGTVGHPIPGVAVRIVDAISGRQVGLNQPGVLLVKGPNVMLGYLGEEEKTAEAFEGDWYNTGDVVSMDEDGFITITDRISRFSKIGGEMVPHLKIEEVLLKGLGTHEHVVAVTSVPDAKKGEQLVVVYVDGACDPDRLREIVAASDLPNMYRPRPENYVKANSIPILGSGKLDITGLRGMAAEAMRGRKPGESPAEQPADHEVS